MSQQARAMVAGLLSLCGAASAATAAEPARLTCAPNNIFQCEAMFECIRVSSESINFPNFFSADLAGKSITGKRPDGTEFKTTIQQQVHEGDALVLQGVEAGRGWSMTVDTKSGRLVIGVAGPALGFVGLGACLVE